MLSESEQTGLAGPTSGQSRLQVLGDRVELLSPESRKDNFQLANNQKNANNTSKHFQPSRLMKSKQNNHVQTGESIEETGIVRRQIKN